MTEVISVRFRNRGKSYFFAPGEHKIETGQYVVVETSKGLACGECVQRNHFVPEDRVKEPLQPVIRPANAEDMKTLEANREKEQAAFRTGKQKIAEHKLDMKLVDVEYNFEGNKILFFFTSDGRVDFRDLVKDLASVFKMRIELRQIGVRDEARMLGGLGICGKPFCCSQFLDDFQSVSIKMAKTQSLSLNPTKISGTCGRLMCCLRYEQEAYEDLVKRMPKHNAAVNTPDGPGTVADVGLLRQKVKVRLENQQDVRTYELAELGLNGAPAPERVEKKPEFDAEDELKKALSRLAGPEEQPEEKREPRPERRRNEGKKAQQPKADKPADADKGEGKKEGQGQNKSRRRRHRGGGSKGQNGGQTKAPQDGGNQPKQNPAGQNGPKQNVPKAKQPNQAKQNGPKPAPQGQKAPGEGGAPKKRHRPRHRKPASGGQNQAPKKEG